MLVLPHPHLQAYAERAVGLRGLGRHRQLDALRHGHYEALEDPVYPGAQHAQRLLDGIARPPAVGGAGALPAEGELLHVPRPIAAFYVEVVAVGYP